MRPDSARSGPAGETRTVVLGLGNPILSDDAVGLAVAAELERRLAAAPLPGVEVRTTARGGFELIDLLMGFDRVILVDCLAVPDPVPGRIRRLGLDDVSGSARLVGGHEISVGAAFQLAAQVAIPMPRDVTIYAVEAGDAVTFAEALTPPVAAAVIELADRIWAELNGFAGDAAGPSLGES